MRAQLAQAFRFFTRTNAVVCARVSGRRHDAKAIISPVFEPLEGRQLLSTTYYVSASGSDSAPGNSSAHPWKTIARVNSATLHPGDKILFQGGKTFAGSIYVPSTEGGTSSSPVVFSTYGSGRATINSGSKRGFDLAQTGGVDISNLNFVGNGMHSNTAEGIIVHNETAGKSVSSIQIKDVDVSGYGREGIYFMADGSGSSINNVSVAYVNTHDNLWDGLKAHSGTISGMHNYLIDHVNAWNIPGDKTTSSVTGNGIFLEGVSQGIITHCVSHDNGVDAAGSVGIWGAMGDHYTIEYCEAYNQSTRISVDGDGFDFDWDTSNSVIEYCYSHNNAGAGYILAAGSHTNSGNTIRYNVSENDGRKNGRAGVQLWGNVVNASIYNNVIYISATSNSNTAAFYNHDDSSGGMHCKNVKILNNIFYTTGGAKLLNITSSVAQYGDEVFSGNCYYSGGSTFKIVSGSTTYSSLSAWQNAAKKEMSGSTRTGYQGDPKLNNAGHGGTISSADNLRSLSAYKLQTSSPLINRGVSQPGILASAIVDFFGDATPKGGKYDIGVDEVA